MEVAIQYQSILKTRYIINQLGKVSSSDNSNFETLWTKVDTSGDDKIIVEIDLETVVNFLIESSLLEYGYSEEFPQGLQK
mmetsp:Transcript_15145/g.22247  ORF Transcript_15145/g.22247 Transcript_15145/m.22247 type:complete len:80 (+) Transcript_15145:56-295(+)